MNRRGESLVLWQERGDRDALQTKMSSLLCLFLLNAFPLLLQATATHALMRGYGTLCAAVMRFSLPAQVARMKMFSSSENCDQKMSSLSYEHQNMRMKFIITALCKMKMTVNLPFSALLGRNAANCGCFCFVFLGENGQSVTQDEHGGLCKATGSLWASVMRCHASATLLLYTEVMVKLDLNRLVS